MAKLNLPACLSCHVISSCQRRHQSDFCSFPVSSEWNSGLPTGRSCWQKWELTSPRRQQASRARLSVSAVATDMSSPLPPSCFNRFQFFISASSRHDRTYMLGRWLKELSTICFVPPRSRPSVLGCCCVCVCAGRLISISKCFVCLAQSPSHTRTHKLF